MSFKNFRRAKSILASLLITTNFANKYSNVKSMENTQSQLSGVLQNLEKINADFIIDILNKFVEYKQGIFNTEQAFNDDFNYLNQQVFNGKLIFDYENMDKFAQYLEVHTIKKFFDCNDPIRRNFKFVHENIPKLTFLLYDFKSGYIVENRIRKALKNNNKNISQFTSIKKFKKEKIEKDVDGWSVNFKYLNTLGLNWNKPDFMFWSDGIALRGTRVCAIDLIIREIRHQNKNEFTGLKKQITICELKEILSFMFVTLHEIVHHVCTYLGTLEKFCGVLNSNYPINMLSGIGTNSSSLLAAYRKKNMKKINELFNKLGIEEKINKIKIYRGSLKNKLKKNKKIKYKELKDKIDNYKVGYKRFGHTEYGTESPEEDIAESIALNMMPCCIDFPCPKSLRQCFNIYTDKLLNYYKESEHKARESKYFESLNILSKK